LGWPVSSTWSEGGTGGWVPMIVLVFGALAAAVIVVRLGEKATRR
jgi:hypothetical protein